MAPSISYAGTLVLKTLPVIRDHHRLFLPLFPDKHLIPKQHFLVHYPRLIQLLGPLSQYSCLRKEAKHRPLKQWARTCNNFKNIAKTVTERHQVQHSYTFLLRKPLSCNTDIKDQFPVQMSLIDEAAAKHIPSLVVKYMHDRVTFSNCICKNTLKSLDQTAWFLLNGMNIFFCNFRYQF